MGAMNTDINFDPGYAPGFGESEVDGLQKALSAGETGPGLPNSLIAGDGFALKIEDLQQTLVNTSFTEEEFQFWRRVTKEGAKQTVTQYNRVLSHGDDWGSGVIAEDETPDDSSSTLERVAELVRDFGVKGGVTLPMQMSQTVVGEAMAFETSERTLDILRKVERMMYYGDKSLDTKQMNGLKVLMLQHTASELIKDLRGAQIQREHLTGAMATVGKDPYFGRPTEAHMNLEVLEGFNRSLYPKERVILPAPGALGEVGIAPNKLVTSRGTIDLVPSVWVNDQLPTLPLQAVGNPLKRPNNPVITAAPVAAPQAGSKFTNDDQGDYFWSCAAANRWGRSVAVPCNGNPNVALTVPSGSRVRTIVSGGGGNDPMWYEFYRTLKGGASGTEQLIARVPAQPAQAATTFDDLNLALPGTSSVFLIQNNARALAMRQLGPLMRLLLAVRGPVFEFMLLLFAVLLLKAPNKHVLLLNVGHPKL